MDDTAADIAARFYTVRRFRQMYGVVRDNKGWTALHFAAAEGKTDVCKRLIEKLKHDVNSKAEQGHTPLLLAIQSEHLPTAIYLIECGADVKERAKDGMTALHFAADKGYGNLVELLISRCADIEVNSLCGSPLQCAASAGKINSVRILLDNKADPNSASATFWAPVMRSIVSNSFECLQMLLKVTSLPSVPDWSINGIIRHVYSAEAVEQKSLKLKKSYELAKERGAVAFKKNDYLNALSCYIEALFHGQACDGSVLSNLSLCWARMGFGDRALADAKSCIQMRPNWAKAHYREGKAWMLLKDYSMAVNSFWRALKLDPENEDIQEACKEAMEADNDRMKARQQQ